MVYAHTNGLVYTDKVLDVQVLPDRQLVAIYTKAHTLSNPDMYVWLYSSISHPFDVTMLEIEDIVGSLATVTDLTNSPVSIEAFRHNILSALTVSISK